MKRILLFFSLIFIFQLEVQAQQKESAGPVFVDSAQAVPSVALSRKTLIPARDEFKLFNPKNVGVNRIIPGKGFPKTKYKDVQKKMGKIPSKKPIFTFDAANGVATPMDPTGVAGPNHYVNAWNRSFSIFDKQGNQLVPPSELKSIGGEFENEDDGDPIVLYDSFADRYLIMQFSDEPGIESESPAGLLIAVSQGSDPVNNGWYTYRFNTGSLPDYPKISLWSDGYYITTNKDALSPQGKEIVFVLERDKMLQGETAKIMGFPLPGIRNNGFYSPAGFNAVGTTPPPKGNSPIVYLQDDAWEGVNEDHLKLWLINVDWNAVDNSRIAESQELGAADGVTPFISTFDGGGTRNIPQPNDGSSIDALQASMMYMTPYRRFPDHNSAVMNFVVDVDPSAAKHAGIRWYELRQNSDGSPWQVFQEGTYAPDESDRFCGSIGMDAKGNIGLGFTVVNDSPLNPVYPSIRYTGRYEKDALGQMSIEEQSIVEGQSPDPDKEYGRYGDYAHLTVDAADQLTFWHNAEYFQGARRYNKVGVFKIAPDFANDLGVTALVAPKNATLGTAEQITITVRNFGSNAQSNFPVSYTINGETVTETFSDNLPAVTSVNYTFSETTDLSNIGETYTVTATTALDIDEKPSNDEFSGEVRNLPAKDVGVVAIASPSTGQNLSANEQVSVTIGNFGGQPQQDIPVSYRIGVRNPVEEVFPGPLPVGEEKLFTFSQTVDLSNPARYRIVAETDLKDDFDPSNDKQERSVAHLNCIPEGSDCSFGDGIYYFQLGESSNERIPCGNGYEDFIGSRDTYSLDRSQDSFTVTVQSYYTLTTDGDEKFSLWIDLNDNAVFEDSEMVISSEVIPTADESYSYDFSLPANAALGQHLMRVRAGDTSYEGDLNDPCSVMEYGTTHDYSINITDSTLSIDDFLSEDAKLLIVSEDYKHFQVVLETSLDAPLRITVHDILGQKLLDNQIESDGEAYVYPLDMSYAARGVYLVRVGTRKAGKVKRIIVK